MQRRNFLQSLMAAAAGLTVAGKVTAAVAAQPTKPTGFSESLAITADTATFERHLDETQRMLAEMLKECRAIRVTWEETLRGHLTYTITYRHAPEAARTSLDDEAEAATATRAPRSVTVTPIASSFDISDPDELGHYGLVPRFDRGDHEIEVEWI